MFCGVLQNTSYFSDEIDRLRQEEDIKELEGRGQRLVDEYRDSQERLKRDADIMSEVDLKSLQRQLQEQQADIELVQRKLNARQQELYNKAVEVLRPHIDSALEEITKARNIVLVLDSGAAAGPSPHYLGETRV